MYKIVAIDDNPSILNYIVNNISELFKSYKIDIEIDTYTHVNKDIFNECYDIYFLDVDMPDYDGIELAKSLRSINDDAVIIFVSNMDQSVFRSFEARPFSFIRKMHFNDEIGKVIHDIVYNHLNHDKNTLTLTVGKRYYKIQPDKVLYIECIDKTLFFYTTQDVLEIPYKLSDIEKELKDYDFLRPHRSFLVNMNHIRQINATNIVLSNMEIIPLSKYRVCSTRKLFKQMSS